VSDKRTVPPHLQRLRDAATRATAELREDPASFRTQRDQAHKAIQELLDLLDTQRAYTRRLAETICDLDEKTVGRQDWRAAVRLASEALDTLS